MHALQLSSVVVLAAGMGSRFGGLKQLAPVGANGAAIMDVLVERAAAAGFERAVIVVGPGNEAATRAHLAEMAGPPIPVVLALQEPVPGRDRPLGTAAAVLAARDAVAGPFAVVNGDDLYPAEGFMMLAGHLREGQVAEHALVAFRVGRTLSGDRPVSRALLRVDRASRLAGIREGAVVTGPQGLRFEVDGVPQPLAGDALVSMNMWAFRPSIFDALAAAIARFVREPRAGEVYLPDVVAAEIAAGTPVRVLVSEDRCFGVTHREDIGAVRNALS